ncbi:hypothetical protein Trydic_g4760 [Trypoxylus dichotomus]
MEVFHSLSILQETFKPWTAPGLHQRAWQFVGSTRSWKKTESDCKGNNCRKRSIRNEENIILTQGVMAANPTKSTHRLSLETNISLADCAAAHKRRQESTCECSTNLLSNGAHGA